MNLEINEHKKNLISIHPVQLETWRGKIFFKYFLKKYFERGVYWIIDGRKPEFYEECAAIILELNSMIAGGQIMAIYYDDDVYEPILYIKTDIKLFDAFFEIIYKLWISYEQGAIIVLNIDWVIPEAKLKDIYNSSWANIADLYESFIFFKSIERDVLWIGKSNSLDFISESETFECFNFSIQ